MDNTHEQSSNDTFEGKVLLAEDCPTNQTLVKVMLGKMGMEVVIANNGLEAVEKASQDKFDIILMDIQMPKMSGYEATAVIKGMGVDTPIIAVTAHAMIGDREKCIKAGCDDYITKPIMKQTLIDIMNKWLVKSNTFNAKTSL